MVNGTHDRGLVRRLRPVRGDLDIFGNLRTSRSARVFDRLSHADGVPVGVPQGHGPVVQGIVVFMIFYNHEIIPLVQSFVNKKSLKPHLVLSSKQPPGS